MSDDLRLCLRKLVMVLACVCLLDVALGGFSRFLFFQQRSGKFSRINKAMASAEGRGFVFGSSHAASHYVPDVLENELGISVYNAGVLGQQILFHRTLESIVLQRVTPDVIILDVDPSTLYEQKESYDRLAELKPFYYRYPDVVGPVLNHRARFERLFLYSKLYQYNSTLVHVIRYTVAPQPDWQGYLPDFAVMDAPTKEQERDEIEAGRTSVAGRKLDGVMVDAMERFATEAKRKNIMVFYFVSPSALPSNLGGNVSFRKIEAIVEHYRIPFFSFRNDPAFTHHYSLFSDSEHLNDVGARLYSKLVADTIKRHLSSAGRAYSR
jgi:hypothetical protein